MEKLLKVSLTIAIIGIFILLTLSNNLKPKLTKIKDITEILEYQKVLVRGKITSIRNYQSFQIISINDSTGKIDVVVNDKLNLSKNDLLAVEGKINIYKNSLQIQAGKIRRD